MVVHLVTAVIKPFKLEEVKDALRGAGILGMTASEVSCVARSATVAKRVIMVLTISLAESFSER